METPLRSDETVTIRAIDTSAGLSEQDDAFIGAVTAERDTDYDIAGVPFIFPAGETRATTTIIVKAIDNDEEDGARAFTLEVRVGDKAVLKRGMLITDDDETSTSITLDVSPKELNEGGDPTEFTVTGTLNGKVFDDDVVVPLTIEIGF